MKRHIIFAVVMLFAAVGFAQKDVTAQYITNATLSNGLTGWTNVNFNTPVSGNGTIRINNQDQKSYNTIGYASECYAGWGSLEKTNYSLTQTITLPAGHYTLVNYSFFRYGLNADTDPNTSQAYLKAGDSQVAVKTLGSITANGYANSQAEGAVVFDSKMYRRTLDFTVASDNTPVEIGIVGTFDLKQSWIIAGKFELIDNDTPATMDAPFDVTGYITNAGFEYRDMSGWTQSPSNYLSTQINDQSFKTGLFYAERWQASGALPEGSMSQTISGLPAGYYKLTANLGGNGTYIDLNGKRTNWTADGDYSVGYVLAENEDLTITAGKTADGTANWIHFDNFRLQFCGNVAEALTTLLNKVTEYASKLPADVYAQLQSDVSAYNQTYTDVDALLAAIAALEALYEDADNYSANFNATYDLLEAALLRFETGYNQIVADGTDYGRQYMSQKAWTDLLDAVNAVTAAMDESSDFSSMAEKAQALQDQLDATDVSMTLWSRYRALVEGNMDLDIDVSAYTADTYTADDEALQTAFGPLAELFATYAATKNDNFDVSAFLGANLDGSSEPGKVFDAAFPNLRHIEGWKVNYSGLAEGSTWIRVTKNTDPNEYGDYPNNLYLRKAWYSSVVTLQLLKERMLPAGEYTLTYKITTNPSNITDLSHYSINGDQTSLANTSQVWTEVTKDFTISDAYAPFDLSFGFVTNNANVGGANAPQIMVTDIELTYNASSQFQLALDAAREHASSAAAAAAIAQWEDYEGHEENFTSDNERQKAINILNNAVVIADNSGNATGLITNADFKGETASMDTQGGGGQVVYPAGWTFGRTYDGWNDTFVNKGDGIFNAWAGSITWAELSQTLSDLPNGQYRMTADVMTDVTDGTSCLAIYGNPVGEDAHTGRSPEVTSSSFETYTVDFQVVDNEFTIGIRSDHAYYQVKNIQLSYVPTDNATAQRDMIQQDYYWARGDGDVDLTDYSDAEGAVLYSQYVNQVIRVSSADAIASTTPAVNIVVNDVCDNFVLTDKEPVEITYGQFTATTATYTRAMGNTFGTLILPFPLTANDDLHYFNLSNAGEELQFTSADQIAANTSVLVKKMNSEAAGIDIAESNVTVQNTNTQNDGTTATGWSAEGYYTQQTVTDEGVFYIANNQFWETEGSVSIAPFRAIYRSADETSANVFGISINDQTVDAILGIEETDSAPKTIYNLQGQRVSTPVKGGIYIIDGKKVLVK